MKKHLLAMLPLLIIANFVMAQTITGPAGYTVVDLGSNGQGDYTQSLILLHEAYNGGLLPSNNAVGTLTAFRGDQYSFNRINVAHVNTSAAYTNTYGVVESISSDVTWKLKTCIYNGTKYLAIDVPYSAAYQNYGFQFSGWVKSSALSLKLVNYMVNGQPVNQNLISNVQDFVFNITQTIDVPQLTITGKVNLTGTVNPGNYQLAVAGAIHSQAVQVDMLGWSD
jgi:hypothetical protein